ncbi:MAG: hypothetical protein PHU53_06395, partial [Thermoplasmata archaeon]|nr:hypothetical protein [Thermoplasmata archaeon]
DGMRICKERIGAQEIEKFARAILHLEYERNRPVSREEAFRDAGVPYANLEAVFSFLNQIDEYPIQAMTPAERDEMEKASRDVLVRSIGSGVSSQKTRLRLSDISINFPEYPLWKAKRVLSYIQRVDQMTFPPEPTPEMDSLLHRALGLPPERRTVIGLVESLQLGVMKAKQLQALLATFKKDGYVAPEVEIGSLVSEEYGGAKKAPKPQAKSEPKPRREPAPRHEPEHQADDHGLARKYCTSHGHLAVTRHHCGAYLCHNCVSGASKCPACHQPLHGSPKKDQERPREPERSREPEPEELDSEEPEDYEEPEEETRPRTDSEVKKEYGTL